MIFTRSIGMSISSAMIIAVAVVMPWPTSARCSSNDAVPSLLTRTDTRFAVVAAARLSRSLRSKVSLSWTVGIAASAGSAQRAAATSVGAAMR